MRYLTLAMLHLITSVLLFVAPAQAAAPPPPIEVAIIVGNNRHLTDPARRLLYADDDAIRFARYFRVLHPTARLWLLASPDGDAERGRMTDLGLSWQAPTRANFTRAIEEARAALIEQRAEQPAPPETAVPSRKRREAPRRQARLFFYFSGHGEEGATLQLEDDYLQSGERWSALQSTGADQVFALLDGCYLGDRVRGAGDPAQLRNLFLETDELPLPSRPPWAGFIGATTPVPELSTLRGGLLTLVALNGLLGLADLDRDEQISFYEWGRYVRSEIASRPGAPTVTVVSPRRDAAATVVDLKQLGSVGLVLDRDFPEGLVQVFRAGTRELVVQLYHHRKRRDDLRLPPERYDVVRFLEPGDTVGARRVGELRTRRIYPAGLTTVEVGRAWKVILDSQSFLRPIFMVPGSQRGTGDLPENAELRVLDEDSERLVTELPFRTRIQATDLLPAPAWSFGLRLENPYQVSRLGPEDTPSLLGTPGASIRSTRFHPLALRGRWALSFGLTTQYGFSVHHDVYGCRYAGDTVCTYPMAIRHQARVGPAMAGSWTGKRGRLAVEQSFTWAPAVVMGGGGIVHDLPHDSGTTIDQWRYVSLSTLSAEVSAAVLSPIGRSWEIGPQLRIEAELFNKLSSQPVAIQASLGLSLRQSALR